MTSTHSNSTVRSGTDCVIDVGANRGEFLIPVAQRSPGLRFIGIEPIPGLVDFLHSKCLAYGLENVEIWQYAIDLEQRVAKFNVSTAGFSAVSSLLSFDSEAISSHDYWSGRSDLAIDQIIEVEVQRLDELLANAGIKRVRFIKIDAQGLDLNVLESAGDYVSRIDAGMLEVPTVRNARLYEDEPLLRTALDRLAALGFEIYAIKPNDPACAEVNVFFHRADVDWREVETDLGLRGIDIYDGKHYWHFPSNSPNPPQTIKSPDPVQVEPPADRALRIENAIAWNALSHERARVLELEHELARFKIAQIESASHEEPQTSTMPLRPTPIHAADRRLRSILRRFRGRCVEEVRQP